jgi:hypothetical protein
VGSIEPPATGSFDEKAMRGLRTLGLLSSFEHTHPVQPLLRPLPCAPILQRAPVYLHTPARPPGHKLLLLNVARPVRLPYTPHKRATSSGKGVSAAREAGHGGQSCTLRLTSSTMMAASSSWWLSFDPIEWQSAASSAVLSFPSPSRSNCGGNTSDLYAYMAVSSVWHSPRRTCSWCRPRPTGPCGCSSS